MPLGILSDTTPRPPSRVTGLKCGTSGCSFLRFAIFHLSQTLGARHLAVFLGLVEAVTDVLATQRRVWVATRCFMYDNFFRYLEAVVPLASRHKIWVRCVIYVLVAIQVGIEYLA